ncbi:MAG: SoxR reducing system RseC family protein [Acidobacteriota bacterium]
MTRDRLISHEGIVTGFEKDKVRVKILSLSACASCHAKGSCSAADMSEKYIDALPDAKFETGEKVNVIIEEKHGWIALLYGILLPFLILVTTLFILNASGKSEPFSALVSLLSLIPYYLFLYFLRGKFEKKFMFRAERRNKT